MSIKRLPIAFMILGLVLKAFCVLLWRFFKLPELLRLLTTYDPGAFAFAERGAAVFFDQRRVAPTSGESAVFEVLLIVGFGVECLIVGFAVQGLWKILRNRQIRQHPRYDG